MLKQHWEKVYKEKGDLQVSWYEETPEVCMNAIAQLKIPRSNRIIDVGGGNSNLAAGLVALGYTGVSVLDISKYALERARNKMGAQANEVGWIESDVLQFRPAEKYDLWHDRATFHFLTSQGDQRAYVQVLLEGLNSEGYFMLSTFSKNGPKKCSGLEIIQHDLNSLHALLGESFILMNHQYMDHNTPFDTTQNFLHTVWKKVL